MTPLLAVALALVLAACGKKEPPAAPAQEPPQQAPAANEPLSPYGGYARLEPLLAELRAEAEGAEVPRFDIEAAFNSGFNEMDYGFLHNLREAGLPPVPDVQGAASEKGGLKCRKDGWKYLERHPAGTDGYEECCRRNPKSKTTATDMGDSVLLMTKGDGYADTWHCYRWQPRRKTWSPHGEEQLVDAFESYADKIFGTAAQAGDQQRAVGLSGRAKALAAFTNRLKHEGARYRLELERKRLQAPR